MVQVLNMEDDINWYRAEADGREGLIPSNYIEMKKHEYVWRQPLAYFRSQMPDFNPSVLSARQLVLWPDHEGRRREASVQQA